MSENEKRYSKFQWFFLVIFIPTVFAAILFAVIMSILGFNIVDRAKEIGTNIPFVSSYFSDEEEEEAVEEVNIEEYEQTINEQQAEIERLQQEVTDRDEEIATIRAERDQLEQRLEIEQELANQSEQELKSLAQTYEAMSGKNAASIFDQMDIDEALLHMSQLSTDARADILSKMDPEKAAQILTRLASQ